MAFSFTVPAGSFADVDAGDALSYSATLADGSGAAGLAEFRCRHADLQRHARPTPTSARIGVRVTATDGSGATGSDDFALTVANVNDARRSSRSRSPIRAATQGAALRLHPAGGHALPTSTLATP